MYNILRNFSDSPFIIYILIAYIISLCIGITFHEFAHAYVAYKNGDDTPKYKHRLSLNVFNHLDLFGTISLLLFGFGWAKPVEINPLNFKNYRKGLFLTSIAGVVMNFFLGLFAIFGLALLCYLTNVVVIIQGAVQVTSFVNGLFVFLYYFFSFLAQVNFCLMFFNLMPVYPLDGFNMVDSFLKNPTKFREVSQRFNFVFMILVLVVVNTVYADLFGLIFEPTFMFFIKIFTIF